MNQCKNEACSNEVTGKAVTCSPKCRKAISRSVTEVSVTSPTVTSSVTITPVGEAVVTLPPSTEGQVFTITEPASLDDYHDPDGRHYATRTNPDLINWGKPMSMAALKQAGFKANRVTIPDDWDY